MVFQEPMSALNPVMKAGKQLRESILAHKKITKQEAEKLAVEWLRKVQLPEPEKLYHRYPHELSGGQKQRVMIAMAMCHHPAVLIADEPTTALDVTVQKEVITVMQSLQREYNTSLIFITHDLALAAAMADDVLVMYKGMVMEYGPAQKVLHAPAHPYTKALLACRPSMHEKSQRLPVVSDFWQPEHDTNIVVSPQQVRQKTAVTTGDAPVILKAENLKVWFAQEKNLLGKTTAWYKAVNDVSFELKKGEVLGLVGESGCGKSTLSRSLMGLIPIHAGHAWFTGKDLATLNNKEWDTVHRQMQMVFQDPFSSLNPRLTIGQILSEPLQVHNIVPPKARRQEVLRLLDAVQLPATAYDRYPHQFSGGQRQRIGIARALSLKPQLLICDESVSALDVSIQAQILNLLKDLQQAFDLTYLFISHDLSVVHYLCDRVMVMQRGEIVENGSADDVLLHPQNAYTQKLVQSVIAAR
jgi:peptide/nickel transport system ATP-binding protein